MCLEFEVMSHGGTERTEDYKAIVVTEAPSVHRATELVCQFYWQFIYKTFIPKYLARICTLHLRRSLCRRHLRDIAFTSVPSVTPCAYYIRLLVYHSIFRMSHKHFKKSCKPLLCNEVDKNINKPRKYPLFLHAPTVPLCLTIATI